jgi:hypothetical protein
VHRPSLHEGHDHGPGRADGDAQARDPDAQARDPDSQAGDPDPQARDPDPQARDGHPGTDGDPAADLGRHRDARPVAGTGCVRDERFGIPAGDRFAGARRIRPRNRIAQFDDRRGGIGARGVRVRRSRRGDGAALGTAG